jgi:hypothetical protein
MKKIFFSAAAIAILAACNSSGDKTSDNKDTMNHDMHAVTSNPNDPPMPEIPSDAKVFFTNLKEGQEVKSPLHVEMGVTALSVDTANGKLKMASGHHHILVDIDSIPTKEVIRKDSVHLHFGNAQTSAEITLPPGKHSLTLQFADALHRSYGSRLTNKVTVNVKQ